MKDAAKGTKGSRRHVRVERGLEVCEEGSVQSASCPEKNTQSADWWNIFLPERVSFISTILVLPVCGRSEIYELTVDLHLLKINIGWAVVSDITGKDEKGWYYA